MKAISVGEGYGRVNLIGEHLDYNGGCVLPLQIKNSIICELSENPENECISIVSDKYQKTLKFFVLVLEETKIPKIKKEP